MNKDDYIKQGKDAGGSVKAAEVTFKGVMRSTLTAMATAFVSVETKNIDTNSAFWLDGFGEIMGKTKKSEASTVLHAYAKQSDKVVKFEGEYNDWITYCRQIRNGEHVAGNATTRAKHVSIKGMGKIEEAVIVMNSGQVKSLLNKLYSQLKLLSGENWEPAFLLEVETLSTYLADSKHPIFQQMGEQIDKVGAEFLERAAAQTAKDKAAENEQKGHDAEPDTLHGTAPVIEGTATRIIEPAPQLTHVPQPHETTGIVDVEDDNGEQFQNDQQEQQATGTHG